MLDRSQQAALEFLEAILADKRGVGVLHGPQATGKSGLIELFVHDTEAIAAVADIDGTGLEAPELLAEILHQFGYSVDLDSDDELLNMLRVVIVQQARTREAPVLILRDINKMCPSALSVLCKLAEMRAGDQFALRIVLVSDRYYRRILESPNMRSIAKRLTGGFELRPYEETPRLILTRAGETLREVELVDSRTVIGRSDFCDIHIDSQSISRQHAILIRDELAVVLIDLRSRNGTFMNGERITSKVLHDSDVISIGDHRLKMVYPAGLAPIDVTDPSLDDTAKMKTIEDARRARRREDEEIPGTGEQSA